MPPSDMPSVEGLKTGIGATISAKENKKTVSPVSRALETFEPGVHVASVPTRVGSCGE